MGERVFGLIGRTLGHSFSPEIHSRFGTPGYRLFQLEPEELEGFFAGTPIGGLNVTIPYKQAVQPYCAGLSPEAQAIGSVNTLVPGEGGLWGYNTDAYGFSYLARRAGVSFGGKKVVVFGGGGSSLTVAYVARREGAREVAVISRRGEYNYGNLHLHRDADILVNTTPVGMYPEAGKAVARVADFPACGGVLDLIYNPLKTALLMEAEALSIPHADGLAMLVAQAKAAEELFFGRAIGDSAIEEVLGQLCAQKTNVVLIGMPGCGKSTVGAQLSELTGRELVDLDREVEEEAGMPIPEIFRLGGEEAFRQVETQVAARCGAVGGRILITGGGVITRPQNYASLHQNGRIYHITRDINLLERGGRPLSQGADLEAMYRQRLPMYIRFRDAAVHNGGSPRGAAEEIWRDFCEHFGCKRS